MSIKYFIIGAASAAILTACGGGNAPEVVDSPSADASTPSPSRTQDIRVVGSSTVYPFSTKVAQEFKNKTGFNVVVEATGSGGGPKTSIFALGKSGLISDQTV